MDKTRHYISGILCELCTKVFADVCDAQAVKVGRRTVSRQNVFAGHRPSAIEGMNEFLVIRTSPNIGEHNVYQQGSVYIEIRVRNLEHGLENTRRLQTLLDKVDDKFPYTSADGRFVVKNPALTISGDDGLEFTTWLVRASLQVNTTDKFAIE